MGEDDSWQPLHWCQAPAHRPPLPAPTHRLAHLPVSPQVSTCRPQRVEWSRPSQWRDCPCHPSHSPSTFSKRHYSRCPQLARSCLTMCSWSWRGLHPPALGGGLLMPQETSTGGATGAEVGTRARLQDGFLTGECWMRSLRKCRIFIGLEEGISRSSNEPSAEGGKDSGL